MDTYISKISDQQNPVKQKKMIIKFLEATNFSHPIFLHVLEEFKLTPDELAEKNKPDKSDKKEIITISEARRLAKIEVLAEIIQQKRIFSSKKDSVQSSPKRSIKTYKNIISSEPDIPLYVPIDPNTVSQRQITSEQKRLERLFKVSENLKTLKLGEEKRKKDLQKELEEKSEKVKQTLVLAEEERAKKRVESDSKRQLKLKKNVEELDFKDLKRTDLKLFQSKIPHDRSKTSLTQRRTQEQYCLIRV